jgi:hypothetical protein
VSGCARLLFWVMATKANRAPQLIYTCHTDPMCILSTQVHQHIHHCVCMLMRWHVAAGRCVVLAARLQAVHEPSPHPHHVLPVWQPQPGGLQSAHTWIIKGDTSPPHTNTAARSRNG